MNKLKSVLCACLVVTMLMGIPQMSFADANTLESETTAEICTFLKSVGVMPQDEQFPPDDELISRAYFVMLALYASGDAPGVISSAGNVFSDVTEETPYEACIETAYRIGYISGNASGLFNPESHVTAEQAVKILCNILGYENVAAMSGGYPAGYMSAANRYGILDFTDIEGGSPLRFADAVQLVYNALNAEIMQPVSFNEIIEYKTFKDETLLTKRHHVVREEGIIDSNAYTSLLTDETDCDNGVVTLNGQIFKTGVSGAENYVGYSVELYYKIDESGIPTALYVAPSKDCNVFSCSSRDLCFSGGTMLSYDENSNEDTVRLNPYITCIVNGRMSTLQPEEIPDLSKAYVTFISNDGDSEYDVALVTNYETCRVSGVSAESNVIVTHDGKRIELDPECDDYTFEILKNGKPVGVADVLPGDVLLVAESEGEGLNCIRILVSDDVMTGTFDEIGDDEVYIDGKQYNADDGVLSSVVRGKEYKVYTDALGNICFTEIQNDMVYGYLYGIAKRGLGNPVCCIFTENSNWVELELADKVKLNQNTASAGEVNTFLGNDAASYRQLVRYNVNDNARITVLETAISVPIASGGEQNAALSDTFRISYEGSARWRSSPLSFDGRFYVDASSKVFSIPPDMVRSQFRIITPAKLPGDVLYSDIMAYDADSDLVCNAVVITGNIEQTVSDSDSFMIVKSKGRILNKNGEARPSLKGFWRGIEMSFPVDTETGNLSRNQYDSLEYGDIIQFKTNTIGEIDYVSLHKATDGKYYILNPLYNIFTVVGARVEKCGHDIKKIRIAYNSDGEHRSFVYTGATRVYIWDSESGTCHKASPEEILEGDMIYASLRYLSAREIIVIRS